MENRLVPLIILLVAVLVLITIGYVVYSIVQEVGGKTRTKMEKKNLMFTKDGMKVGVKELDDEDVLVNIWNHTSFPAYKSRLWNMTRTVTEVEQKVEHRRG
ncbi:hypothetical protein ARAM_006937 [Aspergillus rambellii]|uniref:Uncharacterized protein n=1 Tax=Aspergillus rambellii TaxID=308745 RepID=A0A0F8UZ07_9EURO|nr:hypothetical protein ARAM_006937 [Aspergillus rambellii]